MSNKNWQLQLRKAQHVGEQDSTYYWLDIVTVSDSDKYGPGSKAQAQESLLELRALHPKAVYRIVKVSPL